VQTFGSLNFYALSFFRTVSSSLWSSGGKNLLEDWVITQIKLPENKF
jgi:3-deoxy-D-manno-octulosonic-acid transferase